MKNCLRSFLGIVLVVSSCHAKGHAKGHANGFPDFDYFKTQPPFLPSCEIYKPNYAQCSRYCAQKLFNEIIIGMPELFYDIGSLEPIYIDRSDYNIQNPLAKLDGNLTEIFIRGFSNLTVNRSDVSKDDFTWIAEMYVPLLRFEYNYHIVGQVRGEPVETFSDAVLEWDHVYITMTVQGHLFEKDDLTFYDVQAVQLNLKPTHARANVADFLNTDTYYSTKSKDATFDINPTVFDKTFRPYFTTVLEGLFQNLLKVIFNAIPAKYFISDIPTSKQLYGTG